MINCEQYGPTPSDTMLTLKPHLDAFRSLEKLLCGKIETSGQFPTLADVICELP